MRLRDKFGERWRSYGKRPFIDRWVSRASFVGGLIFGVWCCIVVTCAVVWSVVMGSAELVRMMIRSFTW